MEINFPGELRLIRGHKAKPTEAHTIFLCVRCILGGVLPEKLGRGVRPAFQDPTLFMTKICDIPFPFHDLAKNSKPYLWRVSGVRYNSSLIQPALNYCKHNLRRAFVDFLVDNDEKLVSS